MAAVRCLESVPGLERARSAGVFQVIESETEDLGIRLEVAWILTDSIRTLLGVALHPLAADLQATRAWLTDDQGRAHPLLEVLELSESGAEPTGSPHHRSVLVFGAVAPDAQRLRLEVQRIETAVPGLILCPSQVDPFSPLDEDLALRLMAWEAPEDPLDPVPMGCAEGCWAVEMEHGSGPAWEASTTIDLDVCHPMGGSALRLVRLEGGLTGWRLCSRIENDQDAPPWEHQREWLRTAPNPEMVARLAESEGLVPLHVTPQLRVALKVGDEYCPSERRSGPWGPLRDRCYDFFAPTSAPPELLVADQILGVPLPEPWVYEFHPKLVDDPRSQVFGPDLPFQFRAEVWVEPLYWQEEFMLLAPRVAVREGPVAEAWAARCRVLDLEGNVYPCQGQAWATLPGGGGNLYGLQFPPLHRLTDRVRLEVESVDLLLTRPLEIPCAPGPQAH